MGRREAYLLDINILPLIYLIRAVKDGLFRKVLHFGFRFEYECVDDVDIMIARAIHYNIICCIITFRGSYYLHFQGRNQTTECCN